MFSPYQNFYQYQNQYQYQNMLPQQQIIQVNGKSSVDTIQLAPNSSVLVMDTSAPMVWMCVSDGVGKVTATPYDITIHKETPPININDIDARISKIENALSEIQEKINAKSNDEPAKYRQNKFDKEHV